MTFVQEIASTISALTPLVPDTGIILGSGLGGLADKIQNPVFVEYADLPHMPASTAPGHKGRFVIGTLSGHTVICMQGRLHYYEGHSMETIALPVRVMRTLGAKQLFVTNACGGVNYDFEVGDLMLIEDHINMMGQNPLIGGNDDDIGPRFCDMSRAYDPALRAIALQAAEELSINMRRGVYLGYSGPSYETPAEIRAFRILGADAVGMSTVPEVIAAAHCGLPVLAISLITNMAAGMTDKRICGDHVIEIADQKAQVLCDLICHCLALLPL